MGDDEEGLAQVLVEAGAQLSSEQVPDSFGHGGPAVLQRAFG